NPLQRAERLVDEGKLIDAEKMLTEMHNDRPGDDDVSMLLGHVYLREQRADAATALLVPLGKSSPKLASRIAQEFKSAANDAMKLDSSTNFTAFLTTAVQLDSTMHREVCTMMTTRM